MAEHWTARPAWPFFRRHWRLRKLLARLLFAISPAAEYGSRREKRLALEETLRRAEAERP